MIIVRRTYGQRAESFRLVMARRARWTELRNGLEWVEVIASPPHPTDNGTIFVGTARDGGFKSTNSGAH